MAIGALLTPIVVSPATERQMEKNRQSGESRQNLGRHAADIFDRAHLESMVSW